MPAPYRRVGRIVRTHGIDGEVSVALGDDLAIVISQGDDVWIVPPLPQGAVPHRVEEVRRTPKGALTKISGVDTVAAAHEMVGRWLLAQGEDAPFPDERDGFLGIRVRDSKRGDIGTVSDVIVTGANDVLVVEGGPFGQVLVPVIDDVIGGLTDDDGTLEVTLLDGLIDEELE